MSAANRRTPKLAVSGTTSFTWVTWKTGMAFGPFVILVRLLTKVLDSLYMIVNIGLCSHMSC